MVSGSVIKSLILRNVAICGNVIHYACQTAAKNKSLVETFSLVLRIDSFINVMTLKQKVEKPSVKR